MCLLPPSKCTPVARTAHFAVSPFVRGVSLSRVALPGPSRRAPYLSQTCATPRPDHSRPAQTLNPSTCSPSNRHASTSIHISLPMCIPRGSVPPPSHSKPWKRGQLNMYTLHKCTCTWFATPSHTHMHTCIHPDMPHLPYQELPTHKQRNKH